MTHESQETLSRTYEEMFRVIRVVFQSPPVMLFRPKLLTLGHVQISTGPDCVRFGTSRHLVEGPFQDLQGLLGRRRIVGRDGSQTLNAQTPNAQSRGQGKRPLEFWKGRSRRPVHAQRCPNRVLPGFFGLR